MIRREDGFSLLEIVIATALMLLVTAGVFSLMDPAHGSFATEPEKADLQQRLRVAADALSKDLIMAGAGAYLGTSVGSLSAFFAPVLPLRQGATNADPAGTFATDRITMMYVPSTAAQTTLSADLSPISLALQVNPESGCPRDVSLCGFTSGMSVLVYDDTGAYDMFTITSVIGASAQMSINRPADAATRTYQKDVTKVVEAVSHTYYLKRNGATETRQLMHYDGTSHADVPVVDHVVGLTFDYYGDPNPPALKKPISDPTGPWTTYGPKPPAVRAKPTAYPAGENCTFTIDGTGLQIPAADGPRRRKPHSREADAGTADGRSLVSRRNEPEPVGRRPASHQESGGHAESGNCGEGLARSGGRPLHAWRHVAPRQPVGAGSGNPTPGDAAESESRTVVSRL